MLRLLCGKKLRVSQATLWFLIALILRIYVAATTRILATDGVAYLEIARSFDRGEFFEGSAALFSPFYPVLISLLTPLLDVETSAVSVSVLMGSLTVYPLFGLARRFVSETRAWAPTFLFVFSPYLVRQAGDVLSEPTYFFLVVCFLRLFYLMVDGREMMGIWAGVTAGLAYLARPEGAGLVFAATMILILFNRQMAWQRRRALALSVGAFLLVSIPYVLLLREHLGYWTLSQKGSYNLAVAMLQVTGDPAITPDNVCSYLLAHPWLYLQKVGQNLASVIGRFGAVLHPIVFLFFCFGILRGRLSLSHSREGRFLLGMMIFFGAAVSLFWISKRFVTPLIPMGGVFFAGEGLIAVRDWLLRRRLKRHGLVARARRSVNCLLIAWCSILFLTKMGLTQRAEKRYLKDVGVWIDEISPQHPPKVVCFDSRIAHYAGGKPMAPSWAVQCDLLAYARRWRAHFLIVGRNSRNDLIPEFEEGGSPVDLVLLELPGDIRKNGGEELLVYRVHPEKAQVMPDAGRP